MGDDWGDVSPLWFRVLNRGPDWWTDRLIGWVCWYGDNQRNTEDCYECGKTIRWYNAVYEQYQHWDGDYDTRPYCRRCARKAGIKHG